jgi:sedoheptulokinase
MGTSYIGIDIGTSTICGVIYDLENKRILQTIREENTARLHTSVDWEDLQDPQTILSIVIKILNTFILKYKNIEGLGITGQMHGILYLDKKGNPVSPLFTWRDGRGNLIYKDNYTYCQYLSKLTGYRLASGFGLTTHFYNLKNGMVPLNTFRFCTIMDFVVMKLASLQIPVTDCTNAASIGFFDLENLKFDLEAIKTVDINCEILPQIISSFEIVGNYKNIFISNSIGDNQASFLGSVKNTDESAHITIGTSSQISVYINQYIKNPSVELRPFPGGGYILVGSALSGGYSLVILKNLIEKTLEIFCPHCSDNFNFYAKINELNLSNLNLREALMVETQFKGTREDSSIRGSIKNISVKNFTPENLIFGFLRGICNELYNFFEEFPEKDRKKVSYLVGSGNAIRQNKNLVKTIEEKFNFKMEIPLFLEEAAFGASLLPMIAKRYIPDQHAVKDFINFKE